VTLVASALLSFGGLVVGDSCKCALGLSACLSVPLVVLDLVTGTLMLVKKGAAAAISDEEGGIMVVVGGERGRGGGG
jgi:hypothetical protein